MASRLLDAQAERAKNGSKACTCHRGASEQHETCQYFICSADMSRIKLKPLSNAPRSFPSANLRGGLEPHRLHTVAVAGGRLFNGTPVLKIASRAMGRKPELQSRCNILDSISNNWRQIFEIHRESLLGTSYLTVQTSVIEKAPKASACGMLHCVTATPSDPAPFARRTSSPHSTSIPAAGEGAINKASRKAKYLTANASVRLPPFRVPGGLISQPGYLLLEPSGSELRR